MVYTAGSQNESCSLTSELTPPRHPFPEGREGQELRGMRDRELPLSQRHRLRIRSSLRARYRHAGQAPVPTQLPSPRSPHLHRAFRAQRRGQDRVVRRRRHPIEPCPDCDGWMETRMGRYGRFLGCSNWPDCGYTRNLRESGAGQREPSGTNSPH